MQHFLQKYISKVIGILLCVLLIPLFFDKGLSVGLGLLMLLSGTTLFVLYKLGFRDKKIYLLFLVVLLMHLASTLFMHYTHFQPFGAGQGDELGYQRWAIEAAQSFSQGTFSVKGIVAQYPDFYTEHLYPRIIGALYALTMPSEIIGLMLNIWMVALTIIFVYLIIWEISPPSESTGKIAFVIGLVIAVYPSYVFNSGLLLKDALEIMFIIFGLLFLIKTIKKFTWYNFLILYLTTFCATHFRFYVGYGLILAFISSWFLFSGMNLKKRVGYGILFIILLGFIPQLAFNQGYFGINSIRDFLNFEQFAYYRQVAWNPAYNVPAPIPSSEPNPAPISNNSTPTTTAPDNTSPVTPAPVVTPPENTPAPVKGFDSSFSVDKGPVGYIESFIYVLFGPFPWQIKYLRQALALIETIPWYLLLFFIIDGIILLFRKRIKEAAPLLIFSIIIAVVIAIFDKNFGLIARIRIPVFIALLCVASLSPIGGRYVTALWEKISLWKIIK